MLKQVCGWVALLAVLLGTGCSRGPVNSEDQSDGIVVSGGLNAFLPKSPPSTCAVVGINGGAGVAYGRAGSRTPLPRLTFEVSPYTSASRRYTIGDGISSAKLLVSNDDQWQSANGRLTIYTVDNYVLSGTLSIPGWKYTGLRSPRAINMVGA